MPLVYKCARVVRYSVAATINWFEAFSSAEIAKAQREDPDLIIIFDFLESRSEPDEDSLFLQNPKSKH